MTPARVRATVVFAGLAFAGVAFVAWTQSWFAVVLVDGTTLEVPGEATAPGLAALSLAALALFASLTIAGPRVRAVLAVLAIGIGVLVASSSIGALADPLSAAASTVTIVTGVGGDNSIRSFISSVVATPWGIVAIAAGSCLVLTGIVILLTGRRWPRVTRKYTADGSVATVDGKATPGIPIASNHESEQRDPIENVAPRSAIDDWDSLSKGDDPTRR